MASDNDEWSYYSSLQVAFTFSAGLGLGLLLGIMVARRGRNTSSIRSKSDFSADDVSGDYKMVFAVRNDLKMGKGKIAAQVGHAAIGGYRLAQRNKNDLLRHWELSGQMKVVVKAPDIDTFTDIIREASLLGINTHIVQDAGRTQIAAGSETVLCVGPGPADAVDKLTGHLKLL